MSEAHRICILNCEEDRQRAEQLRAVLLAEATELGETLDVSSVSALSEMRDDSGSISQDLQRHLAACQLALLVASESALGSDCLAFEIQTVMANGTPVLVLLYGLRWFDLLDQWPQKWPEALKTAQHMAVPAAGAAAPASSTEVAAISGRLLATARALLSAEQPVLRGGAELPAPPGQATERGSFDYSDVGQEVPADEVDCSVFAPPKAALGVPFLLQVFSHLPDAAAEAWAMARGFDEHATKRMVSALGTKILRGSTLTYQVTIPGVEVSDAVQTRVWRGRTEVAPFTAEAPASAEIGPRMGRVLIANDGVPIGNISFVIELIARDTAEGRELRAAGRPRRFNDAFISYARKDLDEVWKRVQGMAAAGVRYHQDIFELEPGERWLPRIYELIDLSDVFFLFWTEAASGSEWVEKEWRYALTHKGLDDIVPVPMELPFPAPPVELNDLQFGDKLLWFMRGA